MKNYQFMKLIDSPIISKSITLENLQRLIDGDMAHIGAAILDGKEIYNSKIMKPPYLFFGRVTDYTIKPETITLNGIEVPKPLKYLDMKLEQVYWFTSPCILSEYWHNNRDDICTFKNQPCFATEQNCIDFYAALMGICQQ